MTLLLEKRFKAIADARAILDGARKAARALNAEEVRRYDAFMAEADALKATIERENAQNELDREPRERADAVRRGEATKPNGNDGRRLFGIDADELRGLLAGSGSGAAITPVEYGKTIFDMLAAESVGLQSGFSVVETDRNSLKFPKQTADGAAAWVAEAGTISATDATISQVTATPKKLAARSEFSNELLTDSEPSVLSLLERSMVRALALKADLGFFQGSGSGAEITGLKNVAGISTVSMGTNGAALTNLDPFADALGTLATSNARGTAIVMHPRTWQALTKLKEQTSGNNKPLLQESAGSGSQGVKRSIYGTAVYLSSQLAINETQGTAVNASSAYVYQADQIVVVRRKEIEVVVNPYRLFDTDQTELRAIARLDLVVPHAPSVVRILGIIP